VADFVAVWIRSSPSCGQRGRLTYRTLQLQFQLDETQLRSSRTNSLRQRVAVDEDGRVLVWSGEPGTASVMLGSKQASQPGRPHLYAVPPHREDFNVRSALEGERKPSHRAVFADLKGSMELLAERVPRTPGNCSIPVLERMMAACTATRGTVNQVMGDGIMALFGRRWP